MKTTKMIPIEIKATLLISELFRDELIHICRGSYFQESVVLKVFLKSIYLTDPSISTKATEGRRTTYWKLLV